MRERGGDPERVDKDPGRGDGDPRRGGKDPERGQRPERGAQRSERRGQGPERGGWGPGRGGQGPREGEPGQRGGALPAPTRHKEQTWKISKPAMSRMPKKEAPCRGLRSKALLRRRTSQRKRRS